MGIGTRIKFYDDVARKWATGKILSIETRDEPARALVRWDDGFRDSTVRMSELREVEASHA